MARKTNLDGLIHCDVCGEDYSATYKRCPFCGESAPRFSRPSREVPPRDPSPRLPEDEEDGYIFDGQDAFDDQPEPPRPVRPKGGKRLATNQSGRRSAPRSGGRGEASSGGRRPPEPINWPRLITFLCSLVIIAAALVIVFTVLYPQLRQDPAPSISSGVSDTPASLAPSAPAKPSQNVEPAALTSLSLDAYTLTLGQGGTHQLVLATDPADWVGEVTWASSNESAATVSSTGLVTNVNGGQAQAQAVITVTAGGISTQCTVSCDGVPASQPPQSQPPAGGDIPAGPATIVNADGGLRVRSGPGTSYDVLASVFNGNNITVVEYAGDGWYEITFSGPGGEPTTGYIMGDYISAS